MPEGTAGPVGKTPDGVAEEAELRPGLEALEAAEEEGFWFPYPEPGAVPEGTEGAVPEGTALEGGKTPEL